MEPAMCKNVLTVALISTIFVFFGQSKLVIANETCSLATFPDSLSSSTVRTFENTISILKCVTALQVYAFKVAEKYWNDIVCLESQAQASTKLEDRLLPYAQRIIRDSISMILLDPYEERGTTMLQFIELIKLPAAYEFLMNEIKSYSEEQSTFYYGSAIAIEIGFAVKKHFGQDSELFKRGVPKILQDIISGKTIQLKNNVTGRYLALNETGKPFNAETIEKNDGKKTSWIIEPHVKDENLGHGGRSKSSFYVKFRNAGCTGDNCYLKQHFSPEEDQSRSDSDRRRSYDVHPGRRGFPGQEDLFKIQLETDTMISIAKKMDHWSRSMLLEMDNGKIDVRPPHILEEQQQDESKYKWIVSVV